MPEPLPETGILANHSSDFMLPKCDTHTVGLTDPIIMEVAPRPNNLSGGPNFFKGLGSS